MRHTFLLAGRFLTASLLLAIGFGASGCGDSATVNPEVELSRLTVSPGTLQPDFSGGTTQYSVDLTSSTTSVTVSAQPAVSGDSVTINGQPTTSRVIALGAAGTTTPVDIVVSESGSNSRTYTVLLRRAGLAGNNSLESLAVSPGTLAPAFDPNRLPYTVTVASNVGSIDVTPTAQDFNATMTVNGQPATSGQARTIPLNGPGQSTTITITVTAQNGSPKTYLLTVSRGVSNNNNLQNLTISSGTLTPTFNAGTEDYTVNVANTVGTVSITPTRQDPDATIAVNGQATTSGQARIVTLNAPGQSTLITIVVTAQNGAQKTYVVTVNRGVAANNNLQSLTISPGTLTPAFNASTVSYTVNVASTVASVTVTPRLQDTAATMTVNGQATNSGQARTITLRAEGLSTLVPIVVTAQNGTQKTYVVEIFRAALGGNNNLSALTVSPGSLDSAFNANDLSYTVNVASTVTSITVTPTRQDPNATITMNGTPATSGQGRSIALNGAGSNTLINIVVTAQNSSQKTYTVNVSRAAPASNNNLSALSVTPGSLAPGFASGTLSYTVGVATDVSSIDVSATKADANAVMSGDVTAGTGVATGQATIPLNGAGTSTSVSMTVTAPNQTSKTYSITVNRAAPAAPAPPPAPASAPDLIAEDDSCPRDTGTNECLPGTSDADNITNVTTPSFTVAQPEAGQTPNLYVDGVKAKEGFDQGANTLTPTTALSDGDHTITSTVTNAAGIESPQSPALTVTIDTGAPGTPTP
jgi:hypothetical protein